MADVDKQLEEQALSRADGSEEAFSGQPDPGVAKPERVPARDESDEKYYEEHEGLPTTEDRPDREVRQEEAEQLSERAEAKKAIDAEKAEVGTISSAAGAMQAQAQKSEDVRQVESVLQEGLHEAYQAMPPEQQQAFKRAGEEAAGKIAVLLRQSKVQVNKILDLIRRWLRLIPGVNKYFLEQESKIKTDELLRLKKEKGEGNMIEQ